MTDKTPFLTARWLDLGLVTYQIPADLLAGHLPRQLEADRLPGDPAAVAYASIVPFRFVDTRVRGVSVPLHTDFPEVNLRVYVRERSGQRRRGVLFIAELVPRAAIAMVANLVYHEHYQALPLEVVAQDVDEQTRELRCVIELDEREHKIALRGARKTLRPADDSIAHFFKELSWGFGADPDGNAVIYRVDHPVWDVYPTSVDDLEIDADFAELYGAKWGVLDRLEPFHVAYAVGSEVALYPRER